MPRRPIRIFMIFLSALLLALILLSQFCILYAKVPANALQIEQQGLTLSHSTFLEGWNARFHPQTDTWALRYLFLAPRISIKGGLTAFLPWWLLLLAWIATFTLTWRLTRLQKSHAFPIDSPSP